MICIGVWFIYAGYQLGGHVKILHTSAWRLGRTFHDSQTLNFLTIPEAAQSLVGIDALDTLNFGCGKFPLTSLRHDFSLTQQRNLGQCKNPSALKVRQA